MEIDIHDAAEDIGRFLERWHCVAGSGVVDQDVDLAEMVHGCVDQRRALRRIADIGDDGKGPLPGTNDLGADLVEPIRAAGAEHDVRPGFGQRHSKAGTEPGAGTGDHGDLPVKPEQVQHSRHRAVSSLGIALGIADAGIRAAQKCRAMTFTPEAASSGTA
jgi:hypothetical protein